MTFEKCVFRLSLALLGGYSVTACAELYFAPELVANDPQMVADLSRFSREGAQLPGAYTVDIYLNNVFVQNRTVRFDIAEGHKNHGAERAATQPLSLPVEEDESSSPVRDNTGLMAMLTRNDLETMGVNVSLFPALMSMRQEEVVSPGLYIPDAYTVFDFQKMRLDISIPQASMKNKAKGYIEPEQWDEGINAALLSYSFNGSNNSGRYGNSQSHYLNLQSGLNFGAWRLRDTRTWSDSSSPYSHTRHWQRLTTYAGRTIIPWRSSLVAGESSTSGDVFDALPFRGVKLATDDDMYPDTMRGFAPVIRGNASSNAQVSVRQNGNVIYQTYVSPGAFAITDLFPVYSSGDLEVSVKEADGNVQVFTVPYSSLPVLQREGHVKYSVTGGRYRNGSNRYSAPTFAEGTLIWGLPYGVTVYSGLQYSDKYFSMALGSGMNMGLLGALSVDITQANSTLADSSRHQGQSLRFLYARSLNNLGTTFNLTGYRYSTKGFHTLDETALKGMSGWLYDNNTVDTDGRPARVSWSNYYNLYNTKRTRVEASVSQRISSMGSVYLSAIRQTYWNSSNVSDSLQSGLNSRLGPINYSLSYSYSRQSNQPRADKSFYLSLSVALDELLSSHYADSRHAVYATASSSHSNDGSTTQQLGLSGTALDEDNLNWGVSQGYSRSNGKNGSASLSYQGGYGNSSVGYSYSNNYRQLSYGASGGAVLHSSGLTIGQQLGETNVLVAIPGGGDISLEGNGGVHTDWRGYTIKPNAQVYRENRVALNISTLDDDTDIDGTVQRVVPTRGAVVKANFVARHGMRVLMTLMHDGKAVPMGTTVIAGENTGMVGDDGQVYLSGMGTEGQLTAQWGNGPNQHCTVSYHLPEKADDTGVARIQENCHG